MFTGIDWEHIGPYLFWTYRIVLGPITAPSVGKKISTSHVMRLVPGMGQW